MKKKLISLNLALILLLTMLPFNFLSALATSDSQYEQPYLLIDGVIYDATQNHAGKGWTYTALGDDYGRLKLSSYNGGVIEATIPLKISMFGDCFIQAENNCGIYCSKKLDIHVTGNCSIWSEDNYGICCLEDLYISNNSCHEFFVGGGNKHYAVNAVGSLFISGAITAQGGGASALFGESIAMIDQIPYITLAGNNKDTAVETAYTGQNYISKSPKGYTLTLKGNGGITSEGIDIYKETIIRGTPGGLFLYPYDNLFQNELSSTQIGWTDENGTIHSLDEEYFYDVTDPEITLSALWADNVNVPVFLEYYYGFDGVPGPSGYYQGETKVVAVKAGEKYVLPEPRKSGFKFDGWMRSKSEGLLPAGTAIEINEKTTFRAYYTESRISVGGKEYSAAKNQKYRKLLGWEYFADHGDFARLHIYENYSGEPIHIPKNVEIYLHASVYGNEGAPAIFVEGDAKIYTSEYGENTNYPILIVGGDDFPAIKVNGTLCISVDNGDEIILQGGTPNQKAIDADTVNVNEKVFFAGRNEAFFELVGMYANERFVRIKDANSYVISLKKDDIVPAVPANPEYTFYVWEDENSTPYLPGDIIDNSDGVVLEAQYLHNNRTSVAVLIDGNGGKTESGSNYVVTIASTASLHKYVHPENPFQNPDYKFSGYNTEQDGSGNVCLPGEGIKDDGKSLIYNLYAQWKEVCDSDRDSIENLVTGTVKGYIGDVAPKLNLSNGNSVYTASVGTTARDGGEYVWDFEFVGIPVGIYDLTVSKAGHLSATVEDVTVIEGTLDLVTSLGTIRLLAGDVNSDGKISSDDLNIVWSANNYFKSVEDAGVDIAADVNGDGTINSDDLNIIWKTENYLKTESDCTIIYSHHT